VIASNEKYSWVPEKREANKRERGLDIVELADFIFADPNVVIVPDARNDYGENRYLAFAMIADERFSLCFTPRGDKIHLITIFKRHNDRQWRLDYEEQT